MDNTKLQKLPKWAQEYIEQLHRTIQNQAEEYAELRKNFVGIEKTNVKLSRGIRKEKDIYLPDESQVEFTMADGSVYSVRFDRGWNGEREALYLTQIHSFRSSMVVAPSAANVVYIKSMKE